MRPDVHFGIEVAGSQEAGGFGLFEIDKIDRIYYFR
jgi:hypothetical protein